MLLISVILFHVISLLFCIFATRATCRYLNKHQVVPQTRYLLFGRIRLRHMALFYVIATLVFALYSTAMGVFYVL